MELSREAAEIEKANVLLLNTCAIRENAEMRVFGELGRLKRIKSQKQRSSNRGMWLHASRRKCCENFI